MAKAKKFYDIIPPEKEKTFSDKNEGITVFNSSETEKIEKPETEIRSTPFKKGLIVSLVLVIILVGIGMFSYFFFQKAEITIWPETQQVAFQEKIKISPTVSETNIGDKIIPGRFFEEEKEISEKFVSTGKLEKKAKGTIRVHNKHHSQITLKADTRFLPPAEEILYFCALDKIIIPAKGYVDVPVEACLPGFGGKYNIQPSKFSVPGLQGSELYYNVYGESFSPMSGGGTVSQIAQEDLEKAKNVLFEKAKLELKNSLKTETSPDFILPDEGIFQEIVQISFSAGVGTETSSFTVNLKAKARGIAFKKADLENFVHQFIVAGISEGMEVYKESLRVNYSFSGLNAETNEVIFVSEFSAKIYQDLNLASLRKNLLGKSLKETKVILEDQPQINEIKIKISPFFLKKIPNDEAKVKIIFEFGN